MQTINKSLIKNTFTYTWFIYPVSAVLLTLIWLWSFPTFHMPSAHQKIDAFFATDITNNIFADNILKKYDRENLRQINPSYALPGSALYAQKLQIAIGHSDVLVLTKTQFSQYKIDYSLFFVPVTSYIQEKCQINESQVFDGYGITLKNKGENHYLESYMNFADDDYVIALSVTSKNMGSAINEDNAPHDNALTFVHYLLECER